MNPLQENNHSKKSITFFKKLSFAGSFLAVFIGISVLIGYILQIQLLKSIFPDIVAMNPATAIAFILSGIAILILLYEKPQRSLYTLGFFLAIIVALIGTTKLVGIVFSQDVYFDHLLFSSDLKDTVVGYPNRIAPNTALVFFLVGLSISLLYRGKYKVANFLSFVTGFIALITILGYLYGVKNLIGFSQYIPMALNTGIGFIFLSMSALFAIPKKGIIKILSSNNAGGIASRQLIPFAIFLPILLGYVRLVALHSNVLSIELGLAFAVVANITIFSVLILRIALSLEKVDQERERVHTQIEKEGIRNATLLESIVDCVFALDSECKITLWNKTAEELTGWSKNDVLGKSYRDVVRLVGEDGKEDRAAFIEEIIVTGEIRRIMPNTFLVAKDGRHIPVGDSAAPILNSSKKVEGAIVVLRDLTQEKELDNAKNEFVSLAAHQLRTPLGIIRWSIEALLKKNNIEKEVEQSLKSILESDLNLISSVNDILNVAHINSGQTVAKIKKLDVAEEIKKAIEFIEPLAKEKGVVIKIDSKDTKIMVDADQELFSQVIKNVLSNAVKYNKKEGSVRVSLQEDKSKVEIKITDTGIGISALDMPKIFEKFNRAENASKSGVEGTGLGLFIARHYLTVMHGKINLESTQNQGTTVYITLPAAI